MLKGSVLLSGVNTSCLTSNPTSICHVLALVSAMRDR